MATEVRKVETNKELAEFIDLPWTIYQNYPHWVPPLKKEVEKLITPGKHPFWNHAQRELYIALTNGRIAGRIAAIRDEHHDKVHGEKAGFFGFFETIEDYETAEALFNAARSWCKARGCTFVRGPASPSSNDEYGFLLEGFDKDPAIMMPYNPEYYLRLSERYGFKKAKDLYAFLKMVNSDIPARIEKIMQRARKRSPFKLRPIDPKNFKKDVEIVKTIYNCAWEKNWGFVPMTDEEMNLTAESMKPFYDPELIIIAELDGKPAGVALTVPNVNEVLKKLNGKMNLWGIIKFLRHKGKIKGCRSLVGGCLPEFRKTGLIAEIFYETARRARGRYEWCELSWNLEDNDLINKFEKEIGGEIYKKYRLYEIPV
ncbi:MAG: hypothetical protein ABSH28_15170 [Acidobacteriota bacterium]|jgi:hypothetical protein